MGGKEFRVYDGALLLAFLLTFVSVSPQVASAQASDSQDQVIDSIRTRADIGTSDQRRINRWIADELASFSDLAAFRTRFSDQYDNSKNSSEFKKQFALQAADVASQMLSRRDVSSKITHAFATVLLDLDRLETHSGFLAGLKSNHAATRYTCARGLQSLRLAIGPDGEKFAQTATALEEAGLSESDPIVLRRIYEALAYPTHVATVVNIYQRIFDKRLTDRRGPATEVDGAEYFAFDFLSQGAVLGALSDEQKRKLVGAVAVFVRIAAERYSVAKLEFPEIDLIERSLTTGEEILAGIVKTSGGSIRNVMEAGGRPNRVKVLQEAYKWTGNPATQATGSLNAAPWNVPVGAP